MSARLVGAACSYFAIVFAVGFALGVPRTLWLEPALGELAAVLCELPLVLSASWMAAGFVVRRWRLPPARAVRFGVGLVAFVLLLMAEFGLALVFEGAAPREFAAAMLRPAGAVGLAGQVVFAALPALRRPAGESLPGPAAVGRGAP